MHPYLLIGNLKLPVYWLLSLLGLALAALLLRQRNRRYRLPGDDALHIGILATVGALIGAKLLYLLTVLPELITYARLWLAEPALLLSGGAVFYGGLYGGLAAVLLYCRKYRVDKARAAALFTPAIPLFHAWGRLGCFFSGCCWGIPWARGPVYQEALAAPNGIPLLPVQLIAAALLLLLFGFLLLAETRLTQKHLLFPLYLALYSGGRFILEFFRGDTLRGIFLLSTSQWIAAASLCGLIIWFFRRSKGGNGQQ